MRVPRGAAQFQELHAKARGGRNKRSHLGLALLLESYRYRSSVCGACDNRAVASSSFMASRAPASCSPSICSASALAITTRWCANPRTANEGWQFPSSPVADQAVGSADRSTAEAPSAWPSRRSSSSCRSPTGREAARLAHPLLTVVADARGRTRLRGYPNSRIVVV